MTLLSAANLPKLAWRITWTEWKERWLNCADKPTAIGLLHGIFEATSKEDRNGWEYHYPGDDMERVLFLLELAHGHNSWNRDDYGHLRDKAFNALARHFFRDINEERISRLSQELREKLVWFFLDGRDGTTASSNSNAPLCVHSNSQSESHVHNLKAVSEYIRRFCKVYWRYRHHPEMRMEVLEILHFNHSLHDMLLGQEIRALRYSSDEWRTYTPEVIERLKEIALRDHDSIEAGVLKGSEAACLFELASIAVAEKARQEELALLEAQRRATSERISQLAHPQPNA